MSEVLVHNYNNVTIQQLKNDGFVNLTQMGKAANKLVADYLRLNSTTEYLQALSSDMGIPISLLIEVIKGNHADSRQQGTWAHVLIAMDFAQWCSPQFRIWANKTLLEVMKEKAHPEVKQLTIAEQMVLFWQAQVELESQQKQIQERLAVIEAEKEQARLQIKDLPYSTEPAQPMTIRATINKIVREYATSVQLSYSEVWKQLYSAFLYRYNINVIRRAKNRQMSVLDYLESENQLTELYNLASELFKL